MSGLLSAGVAVSEAPASAQEPKAYNAPQTGNPIIAGYFADPTIRKFGDTYYIYATTDGNGGGLGPSQVWVSKDFVNWSIMPMNWPTTHWIWAPDVWEENGKYYFLYCQPCELFLGEAETPRGPWKGVTESDNTPIMRDRFVTNCITLDGQHFKDDDGQIYAYFGTWGIYPGFGCGVCKLDENMLPTEEKRLIVNTEATEFFEAPYVIKRNGIYYLTYSAGSCHDHTYRVKYAISKTGPMGPYESPADNVILETNADGTVHGPGHHAILEENGEYYMVYHRHDNPHSTRGMHRQIAVDKFYFNEDGTIAKIVPTHDGVGALHELTTSENIAFGKPVTVSSYYSEWYKPEYATDDNNGTLWRPATCGEEWIMVDLEEEKDIARVWTQFEYATSYYQYVIETSLDGKNWTMYSDKSNNRLAGSPYVDFGNVKARYIRLTFKGSQKRGTSAALWGIKVFAESHIDPPQLLVATDARSFNDGSLYNYNGMMGHRFTASANVKTDNVDDMLCVKLPALTGRLTSTFNMPESFYNGGSWTISYKIYGTPAQAMTKVFNWNEKQAKVLAKCKDKSSQQAWHNVAVVCSGSEAKVYLDFEYVGKYKVKAGETPRQLVIAAKDFDLNITDLRIYNWAQELPEIKFDDKTDLPEVASEAIKAKGLLVSIDAADYQVGSSVTEIANVHMGQKFNAEGAALPVRIKDGRVAFHFDGTQKFVSDFSLPKTIVDNAPYTISAWILNDGASDHETIVDLNPIAEDGELGRIVFSNGSNPTNGIMFHSGSYEEFGIRGYDGDPQWHHWAVVYDGHAERVYKDGKEIYFKDLVMRMLPNKNVVIGQERNSDWAFTGYLGDLKIYDVVVSPEDIAAEAAAPAVTNILFRYASAEAEEGCWKNEGTWKGTGNLKSMASFGGKITLEGSLEVSSLDKACTGCAETVVFAFGYGSKINRNVSVLKAGSLNVQLTKKGLSIADGENQVVVPVDAKSGLVYVALQSDGESRNVWVNGEKVAVLEKGAAAVENIVIGDAKYKTQVSEVAVYNESLSDAALAELYEGFKADPLAVYDLKLSAVAVSPEFARLIVTDANGVTLDSAPLLYKYSQGGCESGWELSSDYLFKVDEPGQKSFKVVVKDLSGNINEAVVPVTVDLSPAVFTLYEDDFSKNADYHNVEGTMWDGLFAHNPEEVVAKAENGCLVLASKDRNISAFESNHAPVLYKNVKGDFLAEVCITDYTGRSEGKFVNYLEGGVIALLQSSIGAGDVIQAVQIGTFPYYDQGNILTIIQGHRREQHANMKGRGLDMYIQLERCGDNFYIRTSADGKSWEEMPYSPVHRPDFHNLPVKVGPYQVTYTDQFGEVKFDYFKLWQLK